MGGNSELAFILLLWEHYEQEVGSMRRQFADKDESLSGKKHEISAGGVVMPASDLPPDYCYEISSNSSSFADWAKEGEEEAWKHLR